MPKLFDSAASSYVLLQSGIAAPIPLSGNIAVRVTGVDETNIQLLALLYIYDNFSSSEAGDFYTLPAFEIRQPRSYFRSPKAYSVNSIIRVIPLYDFTKFELWYGF